LAISSLTASPTIRSSQGAYFAVLASCFASLVLLALVFDQLGASSNQMMLAMVAFPLAACVLIGVISFSSSSHVWLTGGRVAPPALGAASALATCLGSTGFVVLPGAFFFLGFDALPFTCGILLGLVLHTILIAPYARKDGSATLAGFIGQRFESRTLRLVAAGALTLPCLLLLIGEFKLAAFLLGHAMQQPGPVIVAVLAAIAAFAVALGGMRAVMWSGAAAAIIALMVLAILPSLSGLLTINIPVPQIAYGLVKTEIARLETMAGMDTHRAASIVLTLPSSAPQALVKPFFQPFVANDPWSFTLLTLTIAMGVASMPALFAQAGASASVGSSRRMSVWLIAMAGAVTVTLPAVAFLTRLALLHALPIAIPVAAPGWLAELAKLGLADFDTEAATVPLSAVHFTRDSTNLLLPLALGLPRPLVDTVLASAAAVALAAIAAEAMALAAMWVQDVAMVFAAPGSAGTLRVLAGRLLAIAAVCVGAALSLRTRADPLTLFTWAMALSGSSAFVLLVLSVWWKRINQHGATAGLLAGSLAALAQIVISLNGAVPQLFGVSGALASILAAPLAAAVAIATSLLTPPPCPAQIELLRDIRMGSGETVRDREARLAQLHKLDAR